MSPSCKLLRSIDDIIIRKLACLLACFAQPTFHILVCQENHVPKVLSYRGAKQREINVTRAPLVPGLATRYPADEQISHSASNDRALGGWRYLLWEVCPASHTMEVSDIGSRYFPRKCQLANTPRQTCLPAMGWTCHHSESKETVAWLPPPGAA